jgi:hypothetical protein|tara:strand:- start:34 stop:954 length:921 start_codon:yes stop_codon:yes gene_type:complete
MNIVDLPNDIHYNIIKNINDSHNIINFKNTCKTFKNLFDAEIKLAKVDLFKLSIIFKFYKYDLKKHEMICRKFSRFKDEFYNGFINFNRNTNKSIFDTTTLVYIKVYIDDLKEFNIKFMDFLEKYNINKDIKQNKKYNNEDNLQITLSIYYGDDFYEYIHQDNFNENRKNILIDYKTNLKTEDIFNRNECKNLEYYKWDSLDKILGLKYNIDIILFIFDCPYIIVSKYTFINNINRLINNYKYKLRNIEEAILIETNNYNINNLNELNDKYDKLKTKLVDLFDIKLKLYLNKLSYINISYNLYYPQ